MKRQNQTAVHERIESIIDSVIVEMTVNTSINRPHLKNYLLQKVETIGFDQFQQLPDDIIKKRIEKVVVIELLKNLFSDINSDELELIKTHAKVEGFFR